MLEYSVLNPEGILVLKPRTPLTKEDFTSLGALVDTYLADHDKLNGVLIQSKEFPGWDSFKGFTAHMQFVRQHRDKIDRIAVVTDSPAAPIAEGIAKAFSSAEVKHFPYPEEGLAMDWLAGRIH